MTIVKINLHKVHADRSLDAKGGQIKINNNVSLKNVESMDFAVEGKKGIRFTFSFSCGYEPDLGKIEVEGQVLFVEAEDKVKEILDGWDKDKKIPIEIMEQIVNAALHKGNVQAIKISEEVSLPSPLPLPKVKPSSPAEEVKPEEKKE
ncbi:hypothetical protein HOL21_02495 [Candidatus Woesearchaeota archaeon]|nr:hypothetical protein [Candidatus Woesearchaeota archaeon]MBT5397061.1 hypothetical protein [Candidatus Woesearchaeota archaeon]MBT5924097.1 hypothetical protein [Candidatus Woesearchaeota archaeon]MBT6367393.1 hypothetical protein [Candidatus Woesearchaeota archaeon]MBT7762461.1 hypothetical protein [Candidatus Woesearchaeota archaeon]